MNFLINLTDQEFVDGDERFQVGDIQIGEFHETFMASLSYWTKLDYLIQWKVALTRICNGNDKSCLITSMFDPSIANFIFWWTLYLDENTVHIQNQILFLNLLDKPFLELNPYEFIRTRETVTDEGDKISEWDVDVDDIKVYLNLQFGDTFQTGK
jgi:hypothetical protein